MNKLILALLLLLSFSSCKKTTNDICAQDVNEYLSIRPACKIDLFNKVQNELCTNIKFKHSDVTILNNSNADTFYIYVVYSLNGVNYVAEAVYDCYGNEIYYKNGK